MYRLPNIVRVIKSKDLKRKIEMGRDVRMEEVRSAFKILTGKPTGKRSVGRPCVDGRTILDWTLKR